MMYSRATCPIIAACSKFKIAKRACIQTEMQGTDVYIKCHPMLAKLIVKCLPGITKYIHTDGSLYCKL